MTLRHPDLAGRQRLSPLARQAVVLALANLSGLLLLLGTVLLVSGHQVGHRVLLAGAGVAVAVLVVSLSLAAQLPAGAQTSPLRRR